MPWFIAIPVVAAALSKVVEIVSDDQEVKKNAKKVHDVSKVVLMAILVFVPGAPKVPPVMKL